MAKLLEEIKYDLRFIRSHKLQPAWYKVAKIFFLAAFLTGYVFIFGWLKTGVFCACFFSLSFLIHMTYRIRTKRFKRSWLDFVVVEDNGKPVARSIGKYYYSAIGINALVSLAISQLLP